MAVGSGEKCGTGFSYWLSHYESIYTSERTVSEGHQKRARERPRKTSHTFLLKIKKCAFGRGENCREDVTLGRDRN